MFLTAGELGGVLVAFIRQPDQIEQRIYRGGDFGGGLSGQFQRKCDIVVDRAGGQQVEVLKDHADSFAHLAKLPFRHCRQFFAIDNDAAAAGPFQHVDAADQGAFSGAAFANDAENFTFPYMDADPAQCIQRSVFAVICFVQIFEFNHGRYTPL